MEISVESIENFIVTGFTVETAPSRLTQDTARLWDKYKDFLQYIPQSDSLIYGVMWHTGKDEYRYTLGVKKPDGLAFVVMPNGAEGGGRIPADELASIEIPSGDFAVSKVPEGMSAERAWAVFFDNELPKKGYEPDKEFEKYFELYGLDGSLTLYAPVKPSLVLGPEIQAFSRIEGINIVPALKLLLGKQRILEIAAKSVGASMNKRLAIMVEKLESGNLDEFRNDIHGLKSSLAQIGADTLSLSAARLEEAAKTGNAGFCNQNLPDFTQAAMALGDKLNSIFLY